MRWYKSVLAVGLLFQFSTAFSYQLPDPKLTPGVLCTEQDPDFKGYDYPNVVARCNRNVSIEEKQKVALNYGNIPAGEWSNYEFDHYMPLCAGGSNSSENLWPQPIDEAHIKDTLELQICSELRAGTMNQAEALQKIRDWFVQVSENSPQSESALQRMLPVVN